MAHKNKSKEDKNLVWIEKKDDEDSSLELAFDVIEMHKRDFNLTIKTISSILLCDRQWVVKNVKDNVKHIFLNENYRRFLNNICAQNREDLYFADYYYFSSKDFIRWLKENTRITRQTIKIDLATYCMDRNELKERNKKYQQDTKKCSIFNYGILKSKYLNDVYNLMNDEGKKYFESIVDVTKRKAKEVVLDKAELPEEFVSVKILKEEMDKSLEIVYRELYRSGAIKYTIANSLVRYDKDWYITKGVESMEGSYVATIAYEVYKE